MSNVVRFASRKPQPAPRWGGIKHRETRFSAQVISAFVWALILAVALGIYQFRDEAFARFAGAEKAAVNGSDPLHASFALCSGAVRTNCVVDGDTFWFRGEKIRVADIDAPEISPPRCAREAELGEAAKRRLLALLNGGGFTLERGWRDEDRYGRKLRTVKRDGVSLGDRLVTEGLARRWDGARRPWCS
jgi:endonuclease YncB( thermonuclease family)